MKNEASKTRTLDIAFVVDTDHLRRLAAILRETSGTLEYTVTFCDGTRVHYRYIEEVVGLSNSIQRAIVSLIAGTADVASTVGEQSKSAFVNLKKNGSPSVEYTIYGSQRDVIYFANQLDDWVASVRQWYSLFLSSQQSFPGAGLALGLALFVLPLYLWDHLSRFSGVLGNGGSYQWVALPALAAMWTVEYCILQLFPRGTFAFGHGAIRSQFNIYVRTAIVGLVLSVIAGVLANWMTKRL